MIFRTSRARILCGLAVIAFLLRLGYGLLFVDLERDYYWEYGEIAKNLVAGNGYALYHLQDGDVSFRYHPEARPVPSAFMPPGYVAFLSPFFLIGDISARNVLILGSQALLGAFLVLALFRFTRLYFDERAALVAAAIGALLPEFIYAANSYTPTAFYHLLVILLLERLYSFLQRRDAGWEGVGVTAFLCIALLFMRSETALFVMVSAVIVAWSRGWKIAGALLIVVMLAYAPWSMRNALVFDEVVPMTTSGGLNLFRGHNDDEHGAWTDSVVEARKRAIPLDAHYEPGVDRILRERVGEIVMGDPGAEVARTAEKLLYLWLFNPSQDRAINLFYLLPWLLMLGLTAYGIAVTGPPARHVPTFLFLAYSTALAVLFFVLPRYQTMMKVALIPFVAVGLVRLWRKYVDFPRPIS
ncbi:MAG: glycosyltransferase family 39 protein [Bacteroidetes bacterium]|nr:glycosyltransferase family 39 protein [Bacteroidota bacterium]